MSDTPVQTIGVIGAGAFGTALACAFARAGRVVTLWGRDGQAMARLHETRQSPHLPGTSLPASIRATASLGHSGDMQVLVLAVPTQALREVCGRFAPLISTGRPIVLAAKGIEKTSGCFVSDIVRQCLPHTEPSVLSGPGFADDIARASPTALTLACTERSLGDILACALATPELRLYHSNDLRGVEIGGAAKNVLAIAAGIAAGRGFGESTVAALLARSFAELVRFGLAFGARPETLAGLSGLGDLILTGTSSRSRNRRFGEALGRGASIEEAIAQVGLAEGVWTAPVLASMAAQKGIEMPIATAVSGLVCGKVSIDQVIERLLSRPLRAESDPF